jgi:hypothetical protein
MVKNFPFSIPSRQALEPSQPLIQWVTNVRSLWVKLVGREADHLSPTSVEVKNVRIYTSTPRKSLWRSKKVKKLSPLQALEACKVVRC